MGLDMYAYKIKADLVGDQQVDVPLIDLAEKAVGYVHPTEERMQQVTDKELHQIFEEQSKVREAIKEEGILDQDFWYWRKFRHLHGWMKRLYESKGGTDEDFNCSNVRLTLEDLNQLKKDIQENKLVPEKGFFFGSDELFPGDVKRTLEFIQESCDVLKEGKHAIFYTSWW